MSSDRVTINLTLSREQVIKFLERLAYDDDVRRDFTEDPASLLEGIVTVEPADAMPSGMEPPPREEIERAIEAMKAESTFWWPWIWVAIPYVGRSPEGGGGAEAG